MKRRTKLPTPNPQLPTIGRSEGAKNSTWTIHEPAADYGATPGKESGKAFDIRERTFEFALQVIDVADLLPSSKAAAIARTQLAKAGTSIGANVEEADGAITKPDKRHCLIIARKEARETRYWLRIVQRKWSDHADPGPLIREVEEIVRILSAIIIKLS